MGDEEKMKWIDYFDADAGETQWLYEKDPGIEYEFWDEKTKNNTITFEAGEEMLRVSPDGFYVRGVRVDVDAKEAENVYKAFKQWLTWNTLSNQNN